MQTVQVMEQRTFAWMSPCLTVRRSILNQSVTSLSVPGKWRSDSFRDAGILLEGVQVLTNYPFAKGHFHPDVSHVTCSELISLFLRCYHL